MRTARPAEAFRPPYAGWIRRTCDKVIQSSHENATSADLHLGDVVDEQLAPMSCVDAFQLSQIDATRVLTITDDGELPRSRVQHGEELREDIQTCWGVDRIAREYDEIRPLRSDGRSDAFLVRTDAVEMEIAQLNDAQRRCGGIGRVADVMACDADEVRLDENSTPGD